jgi:hypothetical protein
MQNYNKSNPQSGSSQKPNLRVVKSAPPVRLGGTLPTESMEPGNYLVSCENAWLEQRGKSHRAALQFRVVDGKHGGVALRMWIDNAADNGGFISPTEICACLPDCTWTAASRRRSRCRAWGVFLRTALHRFCWLSQIRTAGRSRQVLRPVRHDKEAGWPRLPACSRNPEPGGSVTPGPLFFNPKTRHRHPENTGCICSETLSAVRLDLSAARPCCVSAVPDVVPSALSSVFYLLGAYGAIWGQKFPRVSAHKSRGTGWRSCTSRLPAGRSVRRFPCGRFFE